MAGLVGYASSDEESEVEQQSPPKQQPSPKPSAARKTSQEPTPAKTSQNAPQQGPEPQPSAAPLGPSLPPMATAPPPQQQPQDQDLPLTAEETNTTAPSSPYSTTRSLLHDLTLPSIPNFDIPDSPPPATGTSPSPSQAATSKKFEQFLQLKKKGTHFNAKLEQSAALRNPSLTDKLLAFVDISSGNAGAGSGTAGRAAEYTTTLPADLWDPGAFPDWAFRDQLRRTREVVAKEREVARSGPGRSAVEFVAAASASNTESPGSTSGRGEKRKGGWK